MRLVFIAELLTKVAEDVFTAAWSIALVSVAEIRAATFVGRHLTWCSTSPPATALIELSFKRTDIQIQPHS